MNINPKVFKAYDIRGIYPTDIDEEKYEAIIKAIYSFFVRDIGTPSLSVVLGRDMRVSSPSLHEVAKKALVELGATVIDIGLTSTPTFYYACANYGYEVGIQVTASHNPKEYAGTKFVRVQDKRVIKIGKNQGMDKVKEYALTDNFISPREGGTVIEKTDVLEDEVKAAIESIGGVGKLKSIHAACDPANGMGGLYVKKLFEVLGYKLDVINGDLDGTFPAHLADPLDFNNLIPLQDLVKKTGAQLGIEPDGDGDRIFFIDEKGEVIPATYITSLISKMYLKNHPGGTVVVDIRYTRNVQNVVSSLGGKTYVSKVGHAFITEDVNREKAFFAGESSGHFYFYETGGAESAVRVILYVLLAMSEENRPISEILSSLKSSEESGEYNFILPETLSAQSVMDTVVSKYSDGELSTQDGIAVTYPGWRFGIRTSNTEPLMRLNVEGENKVLVDEKLKELTELILSLGAHPKSAGH